MFNSDQYVKKNINKIDSCNVNYKNDANKCTNDISSFSNDIIFNSDIYLKEKIDNNELQPLKIEDNDE